MLRDVSGPIGGEGCYCDQYDLEGPGWQDVTASAAGFGPRWPAARKKPGEKASSCLAAPRWRAQTVEAFSPANV